MCRRFAAFLICAASTQGSYSDDFAWHDVARWPCYNSKSRARELAKEASHSSAARCRPPAPVPGQFSITPTLRATWARCLSAWRGPAIWRRGQLAARRQGPARTRRISETHPTRCVSGPRKFNIWATEQPAPRKIMLAGVPQATSETLVGRNYLNTTVSALQRGRTAASHCSPPIAARGGAGRPA